MRSVGLARQLHPTGTPVLPEGPPVRERSIDPRPAPKRPWIRTRRRHIPEQEPEWLRRARALPHLSVSYDADKRILWQFMAPRGKPSFTPELIDSMTALLDLVGGAGGEGDGDAAADSDPIRYLVLGSHIPRIFNLGGDLDLFLGLIGAKDRKALRRYAYRCVAGQYRFATHLGRALTTIALVQGDALGGGFEAALAQQVIVAERRAQFGLPEVLFNLFPGMGAYSFLTRRLSARQAERMIASGTVYSAEELHALGIVDLLADDGCGVEAVHGIIAEHDRKPGTRRALAAARGIVDPVDRDELFAVADVWVEAAVGLDAVDLRKMQHLAKAQSRRRALERNVPDASIGSD